MIRLRGSGFPAAIKSECGFSKRAQIESPGHLLQKEDTILLPKSWLLRGNVVQKTVLKQKFVRTLLFLLAGASACAVAQTSSESQPPVEERVAALKASLQAGLAGQRAYEWIETTTVSIKGEKKSRTQNRCYYAVDGDLQKVPIETEPQSEGRRKPRGIRKRVVEHKKEDIADATTQAVALVKEYIPPVPERIQKAKDEGKISMTPQDSAGRIKLTIADYLKPGDSMTLSLDSVSNALLGIEVATFMEKAKDTIVLTADLATLPDGTIYPSTIILDVKSQNLSIHISNSGHQKLTP